MAESDQFKERLNTNEFRELIPSLDLEKLFLTEVRTTDSNWKQIFTEVHKYNRLFGMNCNVCSKSIPLDFLKDHLKGVAHKKALLNITQFYHPVYTYTKAFGNLARGESVSESELKKAINEANKELGKVPQSKYDEAKSFARNWQTGECDSNDDDKLLDLALKTEVSRTDKLFVLATLNMEDMLKVEYCEKPNEWKPMLKTTQIPHASAKYYCAICSKNCTGIITVDAHLNGHMHKTNQIATHAMRVLGYDKLTKNCVYKYDTKYSLTLRNSGKTFFRNMLDNQSGNDADSGKSNTSNAKSNKEKDGTSKKVISDNEESVDVAKREKSVNKNTATTRTAAPELSKVVAKKAKALASNFTKNTTGTGVPISLDEGLIGVEYVVKLMKSPDDPTPMYECCLCKVPSNGSRMENHLISYNHRLNYCELHYPDTIKKYMTSIGHLKYSVFYSTMGLILKKLAKAIEEYHGRSIPYTISASRFRQNESEFISKFKNGRHASQQKGPSFSNLFSADEIANLKTQTYLPPIVPSNQSGRFTKAVDGKLYLNHFSYETRFWGESVQNRPKSRTRSKSPNIRRREPRNRSRSRARSPSPSPSPSRIRSERRHGSPIEQYITSSRDIWKIYREEVSIAASKVESLYMEYRRNPESHPLYDKEWNKFWKRRKEELISQGNDHRSFNYQPEWVHFFRQRLEQLFGEELHKSTIIVRKHLNIPLEAEEDSKPASVPHINEEFHYGDSSERPPSKSRRSGSENMDYQWNSEMTKSNTWQHPPMHANYAKTEPVVDDKPNVIHALRMMTAVEDYLGSLGSKVMELLSQALVLEKKFHNEPLKLEQNILNAKSCSLLETAVEKLKGVVFAGLLDGNKVQGFNRVIQNTTSLLRHAEKMGWRNIDATDYSEKSNSSNEIQKLIEVMQNKRDKLHPTSQKSLSDTLMELISLQRNDGSDNSQMNNFKQFNLNDPPINNSLVNRNAASSNMSNRLKRGYDMTSTNQTDQMNNMSQMNPSNFNVKQNFRSTFGQMDNRSYMNRANNANNSNKMFNENGSGRNNLGNSNFNSNTMVSDNLMTPLGGNPFGSNTLSTPSLMTNFNSANTNWSNNSYQNTFDIGGSGVGNRARFPSNNNNPNNSGNGQYWAMQQYANKP